MSISDFNKSLISMQDPNKIVKEKIHYYLVSPKEKRWVAKEVSRNRLLVIKDYDKNEVWQFAQPGAISINAELIKQAELEGKETVVILIKKDNDTSRVDFPIGGIEFWCNPPMKNPVRPFDVQIKIPPEALYEFRKE